MTNPRRWPRCRPGSKKRCSTRRSVPWFPPTWQAGPLTPCGSSPKANGGLVGGAELAWDAENGTPLRAAVYAKGESSPVLELAATEISFGPVSDSVFEISPPPGVKTVDVNPPAGEGGEGEGRHR